MSLLGTALGGATTWVTQYALYILGTALVLALSYGGVQTVRLTMAQKDIATANEKIAKQDVLLAANKGELEKLKVKGEELSQRVVDSNVAIQKIERRHTDDLKKILAEHSKLPANATCDDVAAWAREIARRK